KCYGTQRTLSIQIQKLEEELGVKIFDRGRQPIVPTEVGERIIEQARITLNESKKIEEIIQAEKGELSGELRLGVMPTIAPYQMPDVITNFLTQYARVSFRMWEHRTAGLSQGWRKGVLGCALLSTAVSDSVINEMPLFYESVVGSVSDERFLSKK